MNSYSTIPFEPPGAAKSFQRQAEAGLHELIRVGGFDAAYLYSPEGLPLAHIASANPRVSELQVVQWVVMISKMARVMGRLGAVESVHELLLESRQGSKIVFRFLTLFEQPAVLVLLVPPQKAYRGLTNRMTKAMEKWATFA
ncbi:MAG TPA: hypothetical protein PK843_12425 [bacterium]|mgnify:CR=1 FL=1|nr:hypothetical protein [bacterium]